MLPAPLRAPRIVRAAVLAGYALIGAAFPILAAWFAARGSLFN
jgi:membrane protein required for beta-lactamase induction